MWSACTVRLNVSGIEYWQCTLSGDCAPSRILGLSKYVDLTVPRPVRFVRELT
jgi:hypothetical protein